MIEISDYTYCETEQKNVLNNILFCFIYKKERKKLKTICIGGKNNITVNVLEYLRTNYADCRILVIPDRSDDGIDSWQRSVKKYCIAKNISMVSLEQVYDIEDLYFISTEFDRIIRPHKFKSQNLFNIHFSLLPKYKGLFTSILPILNGDSESGVTFHKIRAGIDTGEIIEQIRFKLEDSMTSLNLYDKFIQTGSELVIKNISKILNNEYECYPQPQKGSSYYGRGYIDYSNIALNTKATADQISRQIYAFNFRPYQLIKFGEDKLVGAKITDQVSEKDPGTVLSEDNISVTISTIDYDIVLFKDVLAELNKTIAENNNEKAKELCLYKSVVNEKEAHGWTPLTVAVYNNNKEMFDYLLSSGADINTVNNNGTTLLMYAKDSALLHNSDWTLFKRLIELGISVNQKDYNDLSVFDYMRQNYNYSDIPQEIWNYEKN